MAAPPVDYYTVLEIDSKASQQQVREAYKKAALRYHPDRVPANSPDRASRTKKFQQVNDAYYTLSDSSRRRDYDVTRNQFHGFASSSSSSSSRPNRSAPDPAEDIPRPQAGSSSQGPNMPGGFPWSAFGFGGQAHNEEDRNRFSEQQFSSAFEEMMRDEGLAEGSNNRPTAAFWSIVGGLSGGAMGFIVANIPGAIAGAVAGNRLGAIRDKKGKSVYAVYQDLPQDERMKILQSLAAKLLSSAVS